MLEIIKPSPLLFKVLVGILIFFTFIFIFLSETGASDTASDDEDLILEVISQSEVLLPMDGSVDVTIDWGDGTVTSENTPGIKNHTYASSGPHVVRIRGTLTEFGWGDTIKSLLPDREDIPGTKNVWVVPDGGKRISKIIQWGNVGLTRLSGLFNFNAIITHLPDNIPNTVTSLSLMFFGAFNFNYDIGSWDVSNVTNMESLFFYNLAFNQDIGSWDVSNVTNMFGMFEFAQSFNQNIGPWDVSKATNMEWMFSSAIVFDRDIGSWDVSNVTNMKRMLSGSSMFNRTLENWEISKVTGMEEMLRSSGLSTENYSSTLIGWANYVFVKGAPLNIILGAGSLSYSETAISSRDYLITDAGWTITDGVMVPLESHFEVGQKLFSSPTHRLEILTRKTL